MLCWAALACAAAGVAEPRRDIPDLIGEAAQHVTSEDETLIDLARRFRVGFVELMAANPGVDPWLPGEGTRLELPTRHLLPSAPREGLVVNLAEQRLYYFPPTPAAVLTFPISSGGPGCETPLGLTHITRKRPDPSWVPPESIRRQRPELPAVVPPGPDNPLGRFALDLGWPGYVIHGTNQPFGIGRRVSHGCIRMYPEDIARLFPRVAVGTPVRVVEQAVKLGWHAGELYLEVHPGQWQIDELEMTGRLANRAPPPLSGWIRATAGADAPRLDWALINAIAAARRGLPTRITRPGPG